MRLVITVGGRRDGDVDVEVTADSGVTVGQLARRLALGTADDVSPWRDEASHGRVPMTLRIRLPGDQAAYLLDHGARLGASGVRSGCWAEVLPVGRRRSQDRDAEPVAAHLRVEDAGGVVDLPLRLGDSTVGRDPRCRVVLADDRVSREHATIRADGTRVVVTDLGSRNGTVLDGNLVSEAVVPDGAVLTIGDTRCTVVLAPPAADGGEAARLRRDDVHVRPPRVESRFAPRTIHLPAPPQPSRPARPPVLALVAPLATGAAMLAVSRSPLSLLLVVLSPLLMVMSYLDGTLSGRRERSRATAGFVAALDGSVRQAVADQRDEVRARERESPSTAAVLEAIEERSPLLWSRRLEHEDVDEIRLGTGSRPSRVVLDLPEREDRSTSEWEEVREVVARHATVGPVPVVARLRDVGNLGVVRTAPQGEATGGIVQVGRGPVPAGDPAEQAVAALVMQLAGLRSPADLVLAALVGPQRLPRWDWLKWLPHAVDPGALGGDGMLGCDPLSAEPASAVRLVVRLEEMVASRTRATGSAPVPTVTPTVVVLVLDVPVLDGATPARARLEGLAESGPAVGVHLVWLADWRESLPAACRTYVETGPRPRAGFVRTGEVVELDAVESLPLGEAARVARLLSPVVDAGASEAAGAALPVRLRLTDAHDVIRTISTENVVEAWRAPDDGALSAVVGRGPEGPVTLSLREHGPHAIVGGTTGSGKSELLQAWVMSLAASHSPRRVTFLLVDYKGGAAFAECTRLPHTVGLVTDLTPRLVRRALTSLRAELVRREHLLAELGAKDLVSLEERDDPRCPPALVIVIDELAALVADVPELVDGIVDLAQRGRSLGLHLVLATQRPAGVVKDNVRANASLRIALRVADDADSRDVVGVPDAADIDPGTPGRAVVRWGPGTLRPFQSIFLGAHAQVASDPEIVVRDLPFSAGAEWPRHPSEQGRAGTRDIERLLRAIRRAARLEGVPAPRRPWLEALGPVVPLETLLGHAGAGAGASTETTVLETGRGSIPLGLLDEPELQRQSPYVLDLDRTGNLGVVGAGGSGRSGVLRAVATAGSALAGRPGAPGVEIYGIDAGGGALSILEVLPTVGAVVRGDDEERVGRLVRRLGETIEERRTLLAAAHASTLGEYWDTSGDVSVPRVLVLLDGFSTFREVHDARLTSPVLSGLAHVMSVGRQVGVHVVLTTDRPGAVPASIASSVPEWVVLRLASESDRAVAGVAGDALVDAPPGRGLVRGVEVQLGVWGGATGLTEQTRAVARLAGSLRRSGVSRPPGVGRLPHLVGIADLPEAVQGRPVLGVEDRDLTPVGFPVGDLILVAGPSGSGCSEAVRTMVTSLRRWGGPLRAVLVSALRDSGLARDVGWGVRVCGAPEIGPAVAELLEEIAGGRAPDVIVVEAAHELEGSGSEPLVAALLRAARRAGITTIVETDPVAGAAAWQVHAELRSARGGLVLRPGDGEGLAPFRVPLPRDERGDFPPGRGYWVERGTAQKVQTAFTGGRAPGSTPYRARRTKTPSGGGGESTGQAPVTTLRESGALK